MIEDEDITVNLADWYHVMMSLELHSTEALIHCKDGTIITLAIEDGEIICDSGKGDGLSDFDEIDLEGAWCE